MVSSIVVNLTAQLVQTLCRIMLIAHYEEAEDTLGLPSVTVPVLSSTTVLTL